MAIRIYTKTGDDGTTGLFGGTRLPKYHIRVEAYGNVDELNAYIGVLHESTGDAWVKDILTQVQNNLFTIGSMLALDPTKSLEVPRITTTEIRDLESAIDRMEAELPPLRHFILPSGHSSGAMAHVARTVCRRAERTVVALRAQETVDALIVQYLNRLADYLFVVARYLNQQSGAAERPWVKPDEASGKS